jgi:hypothetical protein
MSGNVDDSKHVVERSSREIADRGLAIYNRLYRADFESKWRGQYAAIDIKSEQAVVEEFPETALARASAVYPDGLFYLVRIGSPGAFKLSRRVPDAPASLTHPEVRPSRLKLRARLARRCTARSLIPDSPAS